MFLPLSRSWSRRVGWGARAGRRQGVGLACACHLEGDRSSIPAACARGVPLRVFRNSRHRFSWQCQGEKEEDKEGRRRVKAGAWTKVANVSGAESQCSELGEHPLVPIPPSAPQHQGACGVGTVHRVPPGPCHLAASLGDQAALTASRRRDALQPRLGDRTALWVGGDGRSPRTVVEKEAGPPQGQAPEPALGCGRCPVDGGAMR